MLILLPPSEGKNSPETGRALNLKKLFASDVLMEPRLERLAAHPEIDISLSHPAHEIYSGVLYQALDWGSLSSTAQKRGESSILIISAIFGALRITDSIPTYKAKIRTSVWSGPLAHHMDAQNEDLIIDCRSSTYAGVWTPPREKTVAVRVFQIKDGKESVITHMSKKYRGELARYLLQGKSPKTCDELFQIAQEHFDCRLITARKSDPNYLDLLIPA